MQLHQAFPCGALSQALLNQIVEQFGAQTQLPLLLRLQALELDAQYANQVMQQAVVEQLATAGEDFAGRL
ncbi:hypothetical protein D3C78_1823620 [compost metagenome]